MMRLCYFPINAAYAFVYGDDIKTAQPIRMVGHEMFFSSRRDAVGAAYFCGLEVSDKGIVSTREDILSN